MRIRLAGLAGIAAAGLLAIAMIPCRVGSAQAETLTLPYSGTVATSGADAFAIQQSGSAGGNAIRGTTTGTKRAGVFADGAGSGGYGVYALAGSTSGVYSAAVQGYHTGLGDGGYFYLGYSGLTTNQAAVRGVNAGGATTAPADAFGQAGVFEITNRNNLDDALTVSTVASANLGFVGNSSVSGGIALHALLAPPVASQRIGRPTGAVVAEDYSARQSTKVDLSYGVLGYSKNNVAGYFGAGNGGFCEYVGGPGWNCTKGKSTVLGQDAPVDLQQMLTRLTTLKLQRYRVDAAGGGAWYIGPTPEDFAAAFELGGDPETINSGNIEGVALAAIQGLNQKLEATSAAQAAEIAELEQRVAAQATADQARIADLTRELADQKAVLARTLARQTALSTRMEAALHRLDAAQPMRQAAR